MGAQSHLYLSFTQIIPQCRLFWAPLCTEGTQVPLSLWVPKGNPSAPQTHSCHSPAVTDSHKVFFVRQDSRKFTLPGFPPPFPLVGVGTRLFLCFVISLLFATIYCWHQLVSLWFRLWNLLEANYHPDNLTSSLIWKKCKLYLRETTCQPKGLLGPTSKQESRQNGLIYNVFFPLIIFYLSSFWQRLGFLPM